MVHLFFVLLPFLAFFLTFLVGTFPGCSDMLLFFSSTSMLPPSLCVLMHFCFLSLLASCFPPFQNSSATFVYFLFLLSLLHRVFILCSARITSAGLSKLFDLRSTMLRATSLFFSTPVTMYEHITI